MGQPNKRIIVLDLVQWFPAEEITKLSVVPLIGVYPQSQLPTRPIMPQVTYTSTPPDSEPPFPPAQAAAVSPEASPVDEYAPEEDDPMFQVSPIEGSSYQLGKKRKPSMELVPAEMRRKARKALDDDSM